MVRFYQVLLLGCVGIAASHDEFVFPCLTPNNDWGFCVSIFSCPTLQKSLGTLQPSAINFIRRSVCRDWSRQDLKVCCGRSETHYNEPNVTERVNVEDITQKTTVSSTPSTTPPTTTVTTTRATIIKAPTVTNSTESHRDYVIRRLLPTIKYCGLQHTDDRFYNDTETAIDEFPWLAHIIYFDEAEDGPDDLEFADRCNGVLINRRYVLSGVNCARNPKKIRLGQYNTNKSVSCVQNPDFAECTEPVLEIRVEEQILMADAEYRFALFRLAQNVIYTDFIRPICLPFHDSRQSVIHKNYTFSGWGARDQSGISKKRLNYDVTDAEECYKQQEYIREYSVNSSYVCLAPKRNSTDMACNGDGGSPLMYNYRFQWYVDALIYAVFTEFEEDCSNVKPLDGIKITPDVVEWILETIRD